jgi:hypothetical protein
MHVHLAHRLFKNALIVDEAHNLVSFLQEIHTKHWWKKNVHFPDDCWTRDDIKRWIDGLDTDTLIERGLMDIKQEVNRKKAQCTFVRELDTYYGEMEEKLKMVPFDIKGNAPLMWPGNPKLIFLSATINEKDLERMGLDNRKWIQLSAGSPIPEENAEVRVESLINMSFSFQSKKNLQTVIGRLGELREEHEGRGLVHCPYGLAEKLQRLPNLPDWLMFHDQQSRMKRFQEWLRGKSS